MKLIADYDLESVPQPDILVVGAGPILCPRCRRDGDRGAAQAG